jgi:hypothetical protein
MKIMSAFQHPAHAWIEFHTADRKVDKTAHETLVQ